MSERFGSVDLTNCDREPIHIPGAIQPHALLLVLTEPALVIQQASANTADRLGVPATELAGRPLASLLADADLVRIQAELTGRDLDAAPHYLPPLHLAGCAEPFEAVLHRYQGALILELEQWPGAAPLAVEQAYASLKATTVQLERAGTVSAFCQRAAEEVRRFTGFDRVMVYRFDTDGSGHILAEAKRDDLESYLGLHYPASDIPKQARELFKRSQLRLNPDIRYTPVPLVPALRPDTGGPLDMSYCVTRAMSPIHVEYLTNMGIAASMAISIVINDTLWGLVACHHYSPRYVSHPARMACEFLAQVLSLQMARKEEAEAREYAARLRTCHAQLAATMVEEPDVHRVLAEAPDAAFAGIEAQGSALLLNHRLTTRGRTPPEPMLRALTDWLATDVPEAVWATDRLGHVRREWADQADCAAGVLAARLSAQPPAYLIWFRPEVTQTVSWAGDPEKPMESGPLGDRLTPRKSFALWQQEVRGRSIGWSTVELEAARTLRQTILEVVVRRAEELVRFNAELELKNEELDSFAYVASHDLKEPLRGIQNFSHFVLEDYGEKLDPQGAAQLQTVIRLTGRMELMLDSLLHYSRLGRAGLRAHEIDANDTLQAALELIAVRLQERGTAVRIPRPLPRVHADPDRLTEVFTNLISNAAKYNDKSEPWIEVGWLEPKDEGEPVLYVRDNGLGIAPEHQESVFRIFRRLHPRDAFGGGVGAGLTIVRRIIDRHGGRIWLESEPGRGSTFYFSFPRPA